MTMRTFNINKIFLEAGFNKIDSTKIISHPSHCISLLWKTENYIEKLRLLRKHRIITDHDVHNYLVDIITEVDQDYEDSDLVKILASEERDGTLFYSDSEVIYNTCWDPYIEFIRNTVLIGGKIDQNKFLSEVFSGDKQEFDIFNYLIENFDFNVQSLYKCAFNLIMDDSYDEQEGKIAFKKLQKKGLDIDYVHHYEDDGEFSEYRSILILAFCYEPILFEKLLKEEPLGDSIKAFPWDFIIENHNIQDIHINFIKQLCIDGYVLPLKNIAKYLEEDNTIYAETIRNLMDN